jgi:hypothetical protein
VANGSLRVCSLEKSNGSAIIWIAKKVIDPLEEHVKRAPANPITQTIEKVIIEIQDLANDLDSINTDKLASDLRDLESKISALRSFLVDHIVRKA